MSNDKPDPKGGDNAQKASKAEMESILARVEKSEDEKSAIGEDIKEIWIETKGRGYDVKALKRMLALRKLNPEERQMIRFYGDVLRIFE